MKKLKFIIPLLFMCLIMGTSISSVSASQGISIYIDGQKQSFSNKAVISKGTTLVPLRGIFEELGADVTWNQSSQTIDASKGNTKIWLKIGSSNAKVNGNNVKLTAPAKVVNGNTLVPLRFISESLGESVKWDNSTRSVIIGSGDIIDAKDTGNIKGTVTWQYNKVIGTKPDVGAKVFLIPTNFNYEKYTGRLASFAVGFGDTKNNLFVGKVNGYGTYEISDIPVGEYLAIIVSEKTTRDFREDVPSHVKDMIEKLLGAEGYEAFETMNLNLSKHTWSRVQIKKDKTLDYSTDFGYTFI